MRSGGDVICRGRVRSGCRRRVDYLEDGLTYSRAVRGRRARMASVLPGFDWIEDD